jgi:hypothetical protein
MQVGVRIAQEGLLILCLCRAATMPIGKRIAREGPGLRSYIAGGA